MLFGILFLFSIIMIMNHNMTGYATEINTTSNVTISTYFAIALSANLTDGIQFGNVTTLPALAQNATHNYDSSSNTTPVAPGTSFWANVSTDSNTHVDFCLKGNANLTNTGGDRIELGNETYANNTASNASLPDPALEVAFTAAYVKAGPNISEGSNNYYRFWLDIPAGTPTGTYNNTVSFKGVSTGGNC